MLGKRVLFGLFSATLAFGTMSCGGSDPEAPAEPAEPTAPAELTEPAETPTENPTKESGAVPAMLVGEWALDIPFDLKVGALPDGFSITIQFDENGRVGGSSGCNRYTGSAGFPEQGGISFGPMAGARTACPEQEMELERSYLSLLDGVTDFRMNQSELELLKEGEVILVFLPFQ
jgi:hypothetical protein